mgnify:FL=1|tara:strand:- start:322 stop:588 length:267 start_codon:yes stop_codon:yes gene_type:complete
MNRKQRRKLGIKKKDQDKMEKQIGLFQKIPTECLSCQKPYDKNNKQLAMKWTVVVREQDEDTPVRLYCDTCWAFAQNMLRKEYENEGE